MPQSQCQTKKRPLPTFPTTPPGRKSWCTYPIHAPRFHSCSFSLWNVFVRRSLKQKAVASSSSASSSAAAAARCHIVCLSLPLSPPGPWWWQVATCQLSPNPGRCRARWAAFTAFTRVDWKEYIVTFLASLCSATTKCMFPAAHLFYCARPHSLIFKFLLCFIIFDLLHREKILKAAYSRPYVLGLFGPNNLHGLKDKLVWEGEGQG